MTTSTLHEARYHAIMRNLLRCKEAQQLSGCRQWIANYTLAGGKEAARLQKMADAQERLIHARNGLKKGTL